MGTIVKLIKKNFVFTLIVHILFMLLSMIKNGITTTYFYVFCLSILIFGFLIFCEAISLRKSTENLRFFLIIVLLDISIIFLFIFSMIEKKDSTLVSYLNWVMIPYRNIMVFFSIMYKIE